MAITAYVGSPGSGKSYSVVAHVILPAIKQSRVVVTNIPMNIDELDVSQRLLVKPLDIMQFSGDETYFRSLIIAGAVFVIDEAWKWLPSGLQANKIPEHFKAFLAEHRHMVDSDGRSTDICLVTQDLSQMASFPRQLIEKTYRTQKLLGLGTRSKFRVDIYEGPVTGASPPKIKLLSKSHLQTYSPDIYKYYRSHTLSDSATSGALEVSADSRGSVFGGLVFKVFIPVAILLLILGIWGILRFFSPKPTTPAVEAPAKTVAASPKPPTESPKLPEKPPLPSYSDSARITGVVGYTDRSTGNRRLSVLVSVSGSKPFKMPFMPACKYLVPFENRTIECEYQGQKISFNSGSATQYAISSKDLS